MENDDEIYSRNLASVRRHSLFGPPPMGPTMSGKRTYSYRCGDNAANLAHYGLSRFSFVYEVPYQEDFGIDFFCTLNIREGRYVYPETPFNIQVKSNTNSIILDKDILKFFKMHMTSPFLVCVVDRAKSLLSFYSCTLIWNALSTCYQAHSINLILNENEFTNSNNPHRINNDDTNAQFDIFIGPPVFEITTIELDTDKGTAKAYSILSPILLADLESIINIRKGQVTTSHYLDGKEVRSYYTGPVYHKAESGLISIAIGLIGNYIKYNQTERLNALISYLNSLNITTEEIFNDLKGLYPELTMDQTPAPEET